MTESEKLLKSLDYDEISNFTFYEVVKLLENKKTSNLFNIGDLKSFLKEQGVSNYDIEIWYSELVPTAVDIKINDYLKSRIMSTPTKSSTKSKSKIMKNEQAVLVNFNKKLGDISDLHSLEDKLSKRIEERKLGEFDGHSISLNLSEGTIYMYGPCADNLFKGIEDILKNEEFLKGAKLTLRYGEIDSTRTEKQLVI